MLAPRRLAVLLITGLPVFLVSLNLLVMAVAFPALAVSFPDSSRADLSWVLNSHNIVFGALLIPAGRAADRWGRRRVFGIGLVVFAAGSLACGLAPTVPYLVAGRVVQGVGSALVMPSSLALLLAAFSSRERATVVTIWGAISSLGAALGPTLGASIVQAAQWRWVFFVYVPIALVSALLGRAFLGESAEADRRRIPDLAGVVILCLALACLALGIVEGPDWGWLDRRVILSFAVAAVLFPAFVVRSLRHPEPLLNLSLFRIRTFSVANLAALVFSVSFYGQVLVGILFLTAVWHYGLFAAALAITPTPVMAALTGPIAGRFANRWGFRWLAVAGGLAYAAGALWMRLLVGPEADYLPAWLPAAILLGIGIGISFPILSAASVSAIPANRFAVGGAVNQTARQVGAVVGVALAVAVLGSGAARNSMTSFDAWFAISALIAAGSAIVSSQLGPRQPRAVAEMLVRPGALAGIEDVGAAKRI
ncbi:MAG TPA: DHA2 family efflux MFS transporter permease subunit [Candidatus Dormibacteraeota bacterium]|nr:DHA2 family efflux MFS transporter permease subunit [Candidatus Dormibacteraeota bacterium]